MMPDELAKLRNLIRWGERKGHLTAADASI